MLETITTVNITPKLREVKRSKKKNKINYKNIIEYIARVFIVGIIFIFLSSIINRPEEYSSISRYHLLLDLNNGEQEAIDRYQIYINEDNYLFNGPLTIHMMAEKYGLDETHLYDTYVSSGYTSAQQFYKDYVQYLVVVTEFENNSK